VKRYDQIRYFNSDSIFINYAQKGFLFVMDDLFDYYEDIAQYLPADIRQKEIQKMRKIASEHQNLTLYSEADYMEVMALPDSTEKDLSIKIDKFESIIRTASKRNDNIMKLRAMDAIFDTYWKTTKYARALRQSYVLDKELQTVTDKEYPGKGDAYYRIGKAFYFFKNYDKALPYLRKALKPAKYYHDRSNLLARNTIGKYYNLTGQVDSAEYYFRSAFYTPEIVKSKPMFDAIALSNIGQSLILKQEYDSAISYLDAGMKRTLLDNNYELSAEAAMGLAKCYLAKDDVKKTKQLIDSAQVLIRKSENADLYQSLYPLMCKYYARTNNTALLALYSDSTILINKAQADKYNSIYLLKAEQELFESEKYAKEEEIRLKEENYKNKQMYGVMIIGLISVGLIIFMILYRKKRNAYRALVQKNQEWAQELSSYTSFDSDKPDQPQPEIEEDKEKLPEEKTDDGPTEEDRMVMKKVYEVVMKDKIFKDLDLTLEYLAKKMDINRNYLSKAINKTTGKNFNTYINEYRVKEAIKLLSSEKSDIISIDAIALEVGFNNRTSFYQSFKKITGLSPSDFRSNRLK